MEGLSSHEATQVKTESSPVTPLRKADFGGSLKSEQPASVSSPAKGLGNRVDAIDAYRGLVMLLMMGEALDVPNLAKALPGSGFWAFWSHQWSHSQWIGCSMFDLIQPGFSFLVGVALPYSLARRITVGQPQWHRTLHAFWRALLLVFLGIFLRSVGGKETYWTFKDTLSQIGLGYGFLYLLALRSVRVQWLALAGILVSYWLLFALYPLPGPGFDWSHAGTSPAQLLPGFAGHWSLNTNPAWAFDVWFLNLLPQAQPFAYADDGGYSTLSFVPTLGTMILGLVAGGVLRSERPPLEKVRWLAVAGVVGLAAGWLLGALGICPVVKRIWTPSWVLFSGGWCMLILAGFYLVMDIWNRRAWAFPLKVVGMNSIAAYMMSWLFVGFITAALLRHLGHRVFEVFGNAYQPFMLGAAVVLAEWLILWWMYRRKIFLRV
jgi:heparan-alpha-glucosaminide N-acetyltransferase